MRPGAPQEGVQGRLESLARLETPSPQLVAAPALIERGRA